MTRLRGGSAGPVGRRAGRAAGSVVLALSFLAPLAAATAARADTVSDESRFVQRINEARVAAGLKPLVQRQVLVDSGRSWAEKMKAASVGAGSSDCLISHNPNLRTAVAAPWKKLGENVGCGDVDADALHEAFMNSQAHRANILDPQFDSVGIGIVMAGDTMFVTEQFMDLDDTAASSSDGTTSSSVPAALPLTRGSANVKAVSLAAMPTKRHVRSIRKTHHT